MTERGLPIVDGAPACPFVAFDDDRDERAGNPDHRHRCYAEVEPAPRALAHQEAYCLSSAFPVCPTFQDWARREAARSRSGGGAAAQAASEEEVAPQRNPPRNWAAPPPWVSGSDEERVEDAWLDADDEDQGPDPRGALPRRGRGLSGSFADRVATDAETAMPGGLPDDEDEPLDEPMPDPAERARGPFAARPAASTPSYRAPGWDDDANDDYTPARLRRRERRADGPAPEWERAKPLEAYPTLRSRRLPEFSVPPLLVGVVAIALAAAVLFALPGLLGFGSPSVVTSASPTTPIRTAIPSPTPTPAPTPTTYTVKAGDTMSRIAGRFGVPLAELIAANADTVPDPNLLKVGQVLIIPAPLPTELPAASEIPAAS